jgi:hypothetical protein
MVPVGVGISVGPAVFGAGVVGFLVGNDVGCDAMGAAASSASAATFFATEGCCSCAGTGAAQEPGQPHQDRQGWPQQHLWLLLPVD